jgi:hypothetical protein
MKIVVVAERGGLGPEALKDLSARAAAKQKKLRRRAHAEFDRLFAETPKAFEARLAAYLARPVTKPLAIENEPASAKTAPTG